VTPGARASGILVAIAVVTGIRWASTAAVATGSGATATLRLTWSARPERLETCRPATPGELAGLPAHMRQQIICTGESAAYRLEVKRDDQVLVDEIVQGGGWRHDRPVHVFHEIAQTPGPAEIEVTFERIDPEPAAGTIRRPDADALQTAALPREIELEQRVSFRSGAVILVTYDPSRRDLVIRE
jgi:hypothetical protein